MKTKELIEFMRKEGVESGNWNDARDACEKLVSLSKQPAQLMTHHSVPGYIVARDEAFIKALREAGFTTSFIKNP